MCVLMRMNAENCIIGIAEMGPRIDRVEEWVHYRPTVPGSNFRPSTSRDEINWKHLVAFE